MTSAITNYAAKKLLGKQMEKYKLNKVCGSTDPYFAEVTDKRGRKRKVKKQIPDFIPAHDAKVLAKVKKTAYRLDMSLFDFAGIRFGWSSVIGIIPAAGDVIDTLLAINVVRACGQIEGGLPSSLYATMAFNIVLDFIVGLVPLLGDLLDAVFKANTRNVAALEDYLIQKHMPQAERERRRKAGLTDDDHPGLEPFPEDTDLLLPGNATRGAHPQQSHAQEYPSQHHQQQQHEHHSSTRRADERTQLHDDEPARKWYTFGRASTQQQNAGNVRSARS